MSEWPHPLMEHPATPWQCVCMLAEIAVPIVAHFVVVAAALAAVHLLRG